MQQFIAKFEKEILGVMSGFDRVLFRGSLRRLNHSKGMKWYLTALSGRRLREQPQPQWQTAWAYRGTGSTRDRRNTVEGIYARWVPIPTSVGDNDAQEFLDDVKNKVTTAIDNVRREVEKQRAREAAQA